MSHALLLVDDDTRELDALVKVLSGEDYHILTACTGPEALKILERTRVHIIIADYKMPEMNGSELLRIVQERYPDIIRIMLSGRADLDFVFPAVHSGVIQRYITKPWSNKDLKATLKLHSAKLRLSDTHKNLLNVKEGIDVEKRN